MLITKFFGHQNKGKVDTATKAVKQFILQNIEFLVVVAYDYINFQ